MYPKKRRSVLDNHDRETVRKDAAKECIGIVAGCLLQRTWFEPGLYTFSKEIQTRIAEVFKLETSTSNDSNI